VSLASAGSRGREGPLFGRTEVLEEIRRLLERTEEGSGGGILLIGTGGVGKTVVLRATLEMARGLGFQVLTGRSLPAEIPQPFSLLQDLLRSAQRPIRPGDPPSSPAEVLPLFLAPYESSRASPTKSSAAAALEQRSPREREEADWLLARLGSPVEWVDTSRSLLIGRLSDFFVNLAAPHPLLLAIDDLHFADDSSLEFLREFASQVPTHPIAIVATVAPEPEASARVIPAIDSFVAIPSIQRQSLRPLTEQELHEYVRWILNGRDPGRDAVMRWYTQTDGNPLFVEHLVRATMGLRPSADTSPDPGERSFAQLLKERIQQLSDEERRILVYAAVLGKEFDFGGLAAASRESEERLSEHLDRLVQLGLLREKGEEIYEFVSETVRADIYGELTETRRRILHRSAARALESKGSASPYELARQFYLGRDDEKAVEYNRQAADLAARAYAFDTAVIHLERALECLRRLPKRNRSVELRVLIELGRFHDELGNLRRSEEVLLDGLARARAEPGEESELALALLGLAQTRSDLSEYTSARELATEAYRMVERLGNERELMAAHRVLGVTAWRLGDLSEAEAHQRSALGLAEKLGTPLERGHTMVDLANTYIQRGEEHLSEALTLYEEAAKLFAAGEDYSARARVLMNRSLLEYNAGRMSDALIDIRAALEAAEKSRLPIWIGYCSLNLAQFQAESNDLEGARTAIDRAATILEPLGDRLGVEQVRMIRGLIAEGTGDAAGANELYVEALRLARDLGLKPEESEMLFRLARLAYGQGDRATAWQYLAASKDLGVLALRGDLAKAVLALDHDLTESP